MAYTITMGDGGNAEQRVYGGRYSAAEWVYGLRHFCGIDFVHMSSHASQSGLTVMMVIN